MAAAKIVLAGVLLVLVAAPSAATPAGKKTRSTPAGPHVVGTISVPGSQPIALAVYERGNKLFVADDASGRLLVVDGTTRQVVSSVPVGGDAFSIVVNETVGKVYVASNYDFGKGTGLISVIDADSGALLTRIDPVPDRLGNPADWIRLANDEVHGKVYASLFCPFCTDLGVIDARTDQFTPILKGVVPTFSHGFGVYGANTVTNEAFAVNAESLFVVRGDTLASESIALPRSVPLDVAVNEVKNKVYLFAIGPTNGLVIFDRATGGFKVVDTAGEDTEPLVFNPRTDTLFSGAQVGERGVIVDGATDAVAYVNFGDGGMGAGAVRYATDNAYFASTDRTYVVNGASKLVQTLATGHPTEGGVFAISVAVDQTRGLVYVVNDHHDGKISVIQDGAIEQCVVPNVKGLPLAAARSAIANGKCQVGTITRSYSASVRSGRVISQKPAAGTRLNEGGKVNLVVSKGKRKAR